MDQPGQGNPMMPLGPPLLPSDAMSQPHDMQSAAENGAIPTAGAAPMTDGISSSEALNLSVDGDHDLEGSPLKRQRMDDGEPDEIDEEAVLALTADGPSEPGDPYGPPE
jgi:hypothetical protein